MRAALRRMKKAHWELDGPAQQEFAALSPSVQATLAAFDVSGIYGRRCCRREPPFPSGASKGQTSGESGTRGSEKHEPPANLRTRVGFAVASWLRRYGRARTA